MDSIESIIARVGQGYNWEIVWDHEGPIFYVEVRAATYDRNGDERRGRLVAIAYADTLADAMLHAERQIQAKTIAAA